MVLMEEAKKGVPTIFTVTINPPTSYCSCRLPHHLCEMPRILTEPGIIEIILLPLKRPCINSSRSIGIPCREILACRSTLNDKTIFSLAAPLLLSSYLIS
jgi:hypothetical protein